MCSLSTRTFYCWLSKWSKIEGKTGARLSCQRTTEYIHLTFWHDRMIINSYIFEFLEEKKLFFTIKLEGLPYATKKKDIKAFIGPNMGVKSIRVPRNIKGIAFVGFATEDQRYDFPSMFYVYVLSVLIL